MSYENLKPFHEQTEEEQRENRRKGGIASGKARRKKADVRKTVQAILDETFDYDGEEKTGAEILAISLYHVAINTKHRQCIQAQKLIYELTGQDQTPEDRKRIKQALKLQEKEIELIQKKIDKDDDW